MCLVCTPELELSAINITPAFAPKPDEKSNIFGCASAGEIAKRVLGFPSLAAMSFFQLLLQQHLQGNWIWSFTGTFFPTHVSRRFSAAGFLL
jgi:hypothetical protein